MPAPLRTQSDENQCDTQGMAPELTRAEITTLVAQNLKEYALKPLRLGLHADQASDCRKLIIEFTNLRRPKSISHSTPLASDIRAVINGTSTVAESSKGIQISAPTTRK
jgi:hypothetical protein